MATTYKMPLSETDAKALTDEAMAALDVGDEDKAIEIARVLVAGARAILKAQHVAQGQQFKMYGEHRPLLPEAFIMIFMARLHPILVKHGIGSYRPSKFSDDPEEGKGRE